MAGEPRIIAGNSPVLGSPPPLFLVFAETDETGEDVGLTFDRDVTGVDIGDVSFVVRQNGIDLGFFQTSAPVANTIALHADQTLISPGTTVTLDYSPNHPGRVVASDNDAPLGAFTGRAVVNNVLE